MPPSLGLRRRDPLAAVLARLVAERSPWVGAGYLQYDVADTAGQQRGGQVLGVRVPDVRGGQLAHEQFAVRAALARDDLDNDLVRRANAKDTSDRA